MLFTGEYEHAIDAKGRLAVPSDIRSRLDPEKDGSAFYAVMGPNGALWLWPERTFEEIAGEVDSTLLPEEDTMVYEELLFSQAARIDLDSAGRIRVPERLLSLVGIDSAVIILGVKDHLELREPGDWAERRQQRLLADQAQIFMRARQARAARMRRDSE